jgi:hypothetical protein
MTNYKTATFSHFQTKNFTWLKTKNQVLPVMAQVKFGTQGVKFVRGLEPKGVAVHISLFGFEAHWVTKWPYLWEFHAQQAYKKVMVKSDD